MLERVVVLHALSYPFGHIIFGRRIAHIPVVRVHMCVTYIVMIVHEDALFLSLAVLRADPFSCVHYVHGHWVCLFVCVCIYTYMHIRRHKACGHINITYYIYIYLRTNVCIMRVTHLWSINMMAPKSLMCRMHLPTACTETHKHKCICVHASIYVCMYVYIYIYIYMS